MRTNKNRYDIWVYILLVLFSASIAFFAVKNIKITPDSIRYGLISEQIMSGNGIRLPMIRLAYDFNVAPDGTIPYLEQPPLVPVLLSILGGITPEDLGAAQILNAICHVAVALFTFLLIKHFYENRALALLTAVLVSVSYPLLRMTNRVGSEPLFIALTTASVYFLVQAGSSGRKFLTAGVCAAGAIMTRFAGIALVPVLFFEAVRLLKNKKIKGRGSSTILAFMLPLLTMGGLFARNYMLSGTMRGFDQPSPGRSYAEALSGTIMMIFKQFQLGERAVILIIVFIAAVITSLLLKSEWRRELLNTFGPGQDTITIFLFSYTGLIFLAMATKQPRFELRYMSPLVPFIFVISILIIVFIWKMIRLKGFVKLSLAGMLVSLVMVTYGDAYKTFQNLPTIRSEQTKYYPFLNSCTYNWIRGNYGKENIIAANDPFPLSFYGGYSTLRLPHNRFNKNFLIPESMKTILPARMADIGARILVLYNNVDEEHEGEYIAGLFNERKTNDEFVLVHECPDGVIYELKE